MREPVGGDGSVGRVVDTQIGQDGPGYKIEFNKHKLLSQIGKFDEDDHLVQGNAYSDYVDVYLQRIGISHKQIPLEDGNALISFKQRKFILILITKNDGTQIARLIYPDGRYKIIINGKIVEIGFQVEGRHEIYYSANMNLDKHKQQNYNPEKITTQVISPDEQLSLFYKVANLAQNDNEEKTKEGIEQFVLKTCNTYPSDNKLKEEIYNRKYDSLHDYPNKLIWNIDKLTNFLNIDFSELARFIHNNFLALIIQNQRRADTEKLLISFQEFKNEFMIPYQRKCLQDCKKIIPARIHQINQITQEDLENFKKEYYHFQKMHFDKNYIKEYNSQHKMEKICNDIQNCKKSIVRAKQKFIDNFNGNNKVQPIFPIIYEECGEKYQKAYHNKKQIQAWIKQKTFQDLQLLDQHDPRYLHEFKPQNIEQSNDTVCFGDFLKILNQNNKQKRNISSFYLKKDMVFEFGGFRFHVPPQGYGTYYGIFNIGKSLEQMMCEKFYKKSTEGNVFAQNWDKCKSTFMQNMRNAIIDPAEIQKVYNEVLWQLDYQRVQ